LEARLDDRKTTIPWNFLQLHSGHSLIIKATTAAAQTTDDEKVADDL